MPNHSNQITSRGRRRTVTKTQCDRKTTMPLITSKKLAIKDRDKEIEELKEKDKSSQQKIDFIYYYFFIF